MWVHVVGCQEIRAAIRAVAAVRRWRRGGARWRQREEQTDAGLRLLFPVLRLFSRAAAACEQRAPGARGRRVRRQAQRVARHHRVALAAVEIREEGVAQCSDLLGASRALDGQGSAHGCAARRGIALAGLAPRAAHRRALDLDHRHLRLVVVSTHRRRRDRCPRHAHRLRRRRPPRQRPHLLDDRTRRRPQRRVAVAVGGRRRPAVVPLRITAVARDRGDEGGARQPRLRESRGEEGVNGSGGTGVKRSARV